MNLTIKPLENFTKSIKKLAKKYKNIAQDLKERQNELFEVLNSPYAVILYESPHRIEKLFEELAKFGPNRQIFAIKEATKLYEKRFLGTSIEVNDASVIFATQNALNKAGPFGEYSFTLLMDMAGMLT